VASTRWRNADAMEDAIAALGRVELRTCGPDVKLAVLAARTAVSIAAELLHKADSEQLLQELGRG
jgi:hypothetical protein